MGATTDKQTLPSSKASKTGKLGRTRMKLIAAIRAEIKESGDFNANQVARRSKSSPANFYNHFATKDAATHAAYDQMMSELAASVSDQCRIESLLDSSMQVFVADWVLQLGGFFAENSSLFRLAQAGMGHLRVYEIYSELTNRPSLKPTNVSLNAGKPQGRSALEIKPPWLKCSSFLPRAGITDLCRSSNRAIRCTSSSHRRL